MEYQTTIGKADVVYDLNAIARGNQNHESNLNDYKTESVNTFLDKRGLKFEDKN